MSRKNANNDGSLRKRANGTWEGRYTDGYNDAGKQIQRSVYGKTRKEVADKIRDILVKKQSGTYIAPSQYLLSGWMTQWLQTYAKNAIKPSTYISYEGYIYNHINPSLGSYPIQQITTPIVQEFYNQKFQSGSKKGGGLSPKTLRNMHNMFHQAMEQARINGIIAVNPTHCHAENKMKCVFYRWKKNTGCCQLLEYIVWAWQFFLTLPLDFELENFVPSNGRTLTFKSRQ